MSLELQFHIECVRVKIRSEGELHWNFSDPKIITKRFGQTVQCDIVCVEQLNVKS